MHMRRLMGGGLMVWGVLVLVGVVRVHGGGEEGVPRGHMEPLGRHRDPEPPLPEEDGWPDGVRFFEAYVRPQRPFVARGAADGWGGSGWGDGWLEERVGGEKVDVELRKLEDRSGAGTVVRFRDFLRWYASEEEVEVMVTTAKDALPRKSRVKGTDMYLINEVSDALLAHVRMPEGYRRVALMARRPVMWMSSGGSRSVLHNDGEDNLNCVLAGQKVIKLFAPNASELVYDTANHGGYGRRSLVDVTAVDLHRFPKLQHARFWDITLHPGDCIYMPARWFHQVNSPPNRRSLAINLWFQPAFDPYTPFPTEKAKQILLALLKQEKVSKRFPTLLTLPTMLSKSTTQTPLSSWSFFTDQDEEMENPPPEFLEFMLHRDLLFDELIEEEGVEGVGRSVPPWRENLGA